MRDPSHPVAASHLAASAFPVLLQYWNAKRGGRAIPSRRDIDPVEMGAELLPHLMLLDLFDRGTRVRFRLVGTEVVKRFGFDPTGRYLGGELAGGWFDYLALLCRLTYAERAPLEAASEFAWELRRSLGVEALLLPLVQDGPDPAIALAGLAFHSQEPFAPTLKALALHASHRELQRRVLTPQQATPGAAGREVA